MVATGPPHWYYSRPKGSPSPYMEKFWSKYTPMNGVVTETLSPFQIRPLKGLFQDVFKNFGKQSVAKFQQFGVTGALFFGVYLWADWKYEQIERSHWY